ncbi:hypothetical protein HA48_04815 [Pantoea wallisii]|uniref:Uncharacterized protein n=1 Tax=Pantoea wallisii TaxID=1076551 RepID=A0A1X1DD16_9GAMM|nr:helix-turn-helix domain-containing protein [Pantoea wallisii]ORM74391.1 hypothetical protein HA48_04815 [Pantoea wallisii]
MIIFSDIEKAAIYYNGKSVSFTPKEHQFFLIMIQQQGQRLDSQMVIANIWGDRSDIIVQNNLSQLAFRVRDKLKRAGVPVTICASFKRGCILKTEKKIFILEHRNHFIRILLDVIQFLFNPTKSQPEKR